MSDQGKEIVIPDYLQGMVDPGAKDMITNTGGAPRISLRGRSFRFIMDGEEIHKQHDPIHVVILGVAPEKSMAKTFYIDGYTPGSTDPPDCSSFFGEVPDNWIDNPQHPTCKGCPQNAWGSAKSMSGKKAKACKDSKRLMVVSAKELKEAEEGVDPPIYILNVTVASLKALSEYGKFLISNNLPMAAVLTQVEFVDSDFPQIQFKFLAVLNESMGKPSIIRAQKKEWLEGMDQPALPAAAQKTMITDGKNASEAVVDNSSREENKEKSDGEKNVDEIINNW